MIKALNFFGILSLVLATGCQVSRPAPAPPPRVAMTINGYLINVEVVYSQVAVARGLSGRAALAMDAGMLFVFETPERYPFWMKEMRFPLDIIWLRNGTVVEVWPEAPAPTAGRQPAAHEPLQTADAVLEINAGLAEAWGLRVGDRIELPDTLDLIRQAR